MKYTVSVVLFVTLAVVSAHGVEQIPSDINPFPGLMSRVRVAGPLDFCGEPVDLENQDVRERLEKEANLHPAPVQSGRLKQDHEDDDQAKK